MVTHRTGKRQSQLKGATKEREDAGMETLEKTLKRRKSWEQNGKDKWREMEGRQKRKEISKEMQSNTQSGESKQRRERKRKTYEEGRRDS